MRTFQDCMAPGKGTGRQQQVSVRAEIRISAFCVIEQLVCYLIQSFQSS